MWHPHFLQKSIPLPLSVSGRSFWFSHHPLRSLRIQPCEMAISVMTHTYLVPPMTASPFCTCCITGHSRPIGSKTKLCKPLGRYENTEKPGQSTSFLRSKAQAKLGGFLRGQITSNARHEGVEEQPKRPETK